MTFLSLYTLRLYHIIKILISLIGNLTGNKTEGKVYYNTLKLSMLYMCCPEAASLVIFTAQCTFLCNKGGGRILLPGILVTAPL
jgi:hypothetical protein